MIIANPIYDIVFKYLMEDERIARTILSALLKEEVVAVKGYQDDKVWKEFFIEEYDGRIEDIPLNNNSTVK